MQINFRDKRLPQASGFSCAGLSTAHEKKPALSATSAPLRWKNPVTARFARGAKSAEGSEGWFWLPVRGRKPKHARPCGQRATVFPKPRFRQDCLAVPFGSGYTKSTKNAFDRNRWPASVGIRKNAYLDGETFHAQSHCQISDYVAETCSATSGARSGHRSRHRPGRQTVRAGGQSRRRDQEEMARKV